MAKLLELDDQLRESSDLAQLWTINQIEKPEELGRLKILIEQGMTASQIAILCDELGRLKYEDKCDPNALGSRPIFFDVNHPQIPENFSSAEYVKYFDTDYFYPGMASIQECRGLVADAAKVESMPQLEGFLDYVAYIKSFHPTVLKAILKRLGIVEPTKGCSGPCRKICAREVNSGPIHHVPFSFFEWLLENYSEDIDTDDLILYWGNDLRDYKSEGKTGVDLIKLFYRREDNYTPFISTVFALDEKTINFVFELVVVNNMVLDRLSRLVTGKHDDDIDKLVEALKRKADASGLWFTQRMETIVRQAFISGGKGNHVNTTIGNAVKPDTPERDISKDQISCADGIVFLAGRGFVGVVQRPNSSVFFRGDTTFPIDPGSEKIRIPDDQNSSSVYVPFSLNSKIALRPLFTVYDGRTGEIISQDKRTLQEQKILDLSSFQEAALSVLKSEAEGKFPISSVHMQLTENDPEFSNIDFLRENLADLANYTYVLFQIADLAQKAIKDLTSKYEDDSFLMLAMLFFLRQINQTLERQIAMIQNVCVLLLRKAKEVLGPDGFTARKENFKIITDLIKEHLNPLKVCYASLTASYNDAMSRKAAEIQQEQHRMQTDLFFRTGRFTRFV